MQVQVLCRLATPGKCNIFSGKWWEDKVVQLAKLNLHPLLKFDKIGFWIFDTIESRSKKLIALKTSEFENLDKTKTHFVLQMAKYPCLLRMLVIFLLSFEDASLKLLTFFCPRRKVCRNYFCNNKFYRETPLVNVIFHRSEFR